MNWRLASVGAFALLVGCLVWMAVTQSLFATGPVSLVMQVGAFALMVWARMTFGLRSFHAAADPTDGGIVMTGPYRYIRHPIYAAIFYFLAGGAIAHFSLSAVIAAAIAAGMLFVRMRSEEILLTGRYPEYENYAAKTARVLPGVF